MILDFLNTNKKYYVFLLISCLALFLGGCSNPNKLAIDKIAVEKKMGFYIEKEIAKEDFYTIYQLSDNRYIYEIYNSGHIIKRDILYSLPEIQFYEDRYIEVKYGVGTGTWYSSYLDMDMLFYTQEYESPTYVKNGIIMFMKDIEEGRVAVLMNPYSYSDYYYTIYLDFWNQCANPAECLKEAAIIENNKLRITYLDSKCEWKTESIEVPSWN